ncbi:MAG: glucose-6-phosphate dehydrogenase [Candidatus Paceibacterota bacterium]
MQNPLTIVVFGATGDLYEKKLASAFFNLFSLGLLPDNFSVMGFARRSLADADFQNFSKEAVLKSIPSANIEKLDKFLKNLKYTQGDLESLESFNSLGQKLAEDDAKKGICSNKLFYLATPPILYATIFKNISMAGLTVPCAPGIEDREKAWTRILVEKPFGKNILDAENLDILLGELFDESQIFRIDHYLAKEALQKIFSFRFMDGEMESIWNKENIDRVRIIFHEKNVVGKRGALYDGLGALRDVGQNHMLQMLALVAMENPKTFSNNLAHKARAEVLEKTSLVNTNKIVRGQYEGYLQEPNVKPNSQIETFFRINLEIGVERWKGVIFELEAGKGLSEALVQVEVYFKDKSKHKTFSISADKVVPYDAYEKVLNDCILGDQTVFITTAEIMAEWRIVTDTIKAWEKTPLTIYKKGSIGAEII